MTLYEFLEQVVERGGDVLSFTFESDDSFVVKSSLEHIENCIFDVRNTLKEHPTGKDRRFGFDRQSYLGELLVSGVQIKSNQSTTLLLAERAW